MAELGTIYRFSVRVPVVRNTPTGERKVVGEEIIEPFKGKKNFPLWMWCRNEDALTVHIRKIEAAFVRVDKDQPVYGNDGKEIARYNVAVFTDLANGNHYDVGTAALPKGIKENEIVKLTLLGCCSIINIERKISQDSNKQDGNKHKGRGGEKHGTSKKGGRVSRGTKTARERKT